MEGAGEPVAVRIVTAPDVACGGSTWSGTVRMIRGRLARRFGEAVTIEHVTLRAAGVDRAEETRS